jgi:hypothetical protein
VTLTIFPAATLDRTVDSWERSLTALTPVEYAPSGILYKREDTFAPLGYGGINGAKLRQLVYLVNRARTRDPGLTGILTACSVHSPQGSMAALVGRHYGLPVTVMYGATRPETAIRHENVRIAKAAGATFAYSKVGFNPQLQRTCDRLGATRSYARHYRLHYGITTPPDASDTDLWLFHDVGARQADNVPPGVRTLVLPAGSCNSATSVLLGLSRQQATGNLSRVVLVGIGPLRLEWMIDRLRRIGSVSGQPVMDRYTWYSHDHERFRFGNGPVLVEHYDLHSTGWVAYADKRPWSQDGIDFHPTYEGKIMHWLHEKQPRWWQRADGDTLFWIVGSAPSAQAMEGHLR